MLLIIATEKKMEKRNYLRIFNSSTLYKAFEEIEI